MMQLPVHDMAGNQVSTVELPAEIFEAKINDGLMWQYYMMQRDNARLGTAKVKTRSEVNRTHAKWYRQKGTGRARHGSRNAPIFVGGGRAHGPLPHKYTKKMPQKMRHAALRSALSSLAKDGQLIFVDNLTLDAAKTKAMLGVVKALAGDQTALILLADRNEPVERSVRNIPDAWTLRASYINVRDLLQYDRVIVPLAALDVIKALLGKSAPVAE
ncbi:MAG: 50S ribosomal protein L4 [Aggregatilineales bacterium]